MIDRLVALEQRIQELKAIGTPGNFVNGGLLVGNVSGKIADGSGAAFPGTPATGALFFRSDLGFLCYYDGTRWLTCHELQVSLYRQVFSATASELITPLHKTYAPYITRVAYETFVATTNNGTNYWTIDTRGVNDAMGASSTIHTFNTSLHAASAWIHTEAAALSGTALPANRSEFDLLLTKTAGAPGNLSISASVFYRLIIT